MGTRGKRYKKVNVFEEPTLLSDVNKIKELATEKEMYNGEALDIEQLIQEISHREEDAPILIKKYPWTTIFPVLCLIKMVYGL